MNSETKRSFYILLCGIIGVFFFLLIERGILLVAFLVGLDVNSEAIQVADTLMSAVATFFGLWYGIWLGLHWYRMVYEEGATEVRRSIASPKVFAGAAVEDSGPSWGMDDLMAARPVHSAKVHVRSRLGSADSMVKKPSATKLTTRKSNSV